LLVLGLLVASISVVAAGPAWADAVYHSERLALSGGSDPTFHGQVVNIHANGPNVGALERYQVIRADASTDYGVWIQVCENGFADFLQTAVLTTNVHGNGHAAARFSTADLEPFSGLTISIRWALKVDVDGAIAYTTECTTVTID
jgi:hypothetical protein